MEPAPVWLPDMHYYRQAVPVDKAVNEYDERLRFGIHQDTGQWVIIMVEGEKRIPILGFNDIPTPDAALRRLYQSDARRRGTQILDDINRHNKAIQKEKEDAAKDAEGILAEAFEYAYRLEGKHPNPRIILTGKGD